MSRSPAATAALAEASGEDPAPIVAWTHPNQTVYQLLKNTVARWQLGCGCANWQQSRPTANRSTRKKFQAALQQIRALTVSETEVFIPAMRSLCREAGHLLHDSKKETYIDVHPVDDPREQRANQFAANFLVPPAKAGELADLQTAADVEAFARQLGIAPAIIVGRLQHDGLIPFSQWNGLKKKLQWSDQA